MKTLMNWEVTVGFRPFRVLAVCGALLVLLVGLGYPRAAGNVSERAPTVPELSRKNAVQAVSAVVEQRMGYLDAERRAALAYTIVEESLACRLDPLFALAVSDAESRMDHEAVSPTGARGLYQLIPSTWKSEVKRRGLGTMEKFNVVHNAKVGVGYLCHLASTFSRADSILLAYNQGPGVATAVLKGEAQPNAEGAAYPSAVWAAYRKLLVPLNLPADPKSMRQLARAPERTVYTPLLGFSGDAHGPDVRPPVRGKVKSKPKAIVAAAGDAR